jgi:hypothetical protein
LVDEADVGEYYRKAGLSDDEARALFLPDTVLPLDADLTLSEEREACRALKGMMLRQEVYAVDGSDKAGIPYTVIEQNFTVRRLQRTGANRYAVFFAHPREVLSYHYERQAEDPRVAHDITLETDSFGNVLKSVSISYGRSVAATDTLFTIEDHSKQTTPLSQSAHCWPFGR